MKNKINKDSTLREVLQIVGTELLREGFNENIHVASTMADIKDTDNVIITDVRFPNEAQTIKNKKGTLIRINRTQDNNYPHESETALDYYDKFDYVIQNDSDILKLIEEVRKILAQENII